MDFVEVSLMQYLGIQIYLMTQSVKNIRSKVPEMFLKKDIQTLTITEKNRYAYINTFELEMSRLNQIPIFQQLLNEIKLFNKELEDWKKDKHTIKNVIVTYHLYQNLASRLKYLSNFSKSEEVSLKGTQEIAHWFMLEKPKIRCQVKQQRGVMTYHATDQAQNKKMKEMIQYHELKRQMEPYQMMSRTMYAGLLPPKQQLKQFKYKKFLPFDEEKDKQFDSLKMKKSSSAGIINKNRLNKYRQSVGTVITTTVSTMNDTKSSFRKTVSQFKIPQIHSLKQQPQKMKEPEKNAQNPQNNQIITEQENEARQEDDDKKIEELQKQKQVQQQKIMERNIIRNLGEEDEPDDDVIYDDEDLRQQKKKYISDNDPEMIAYVQEMAKQAKQSTLRRVMKINEQKLRSKLEDLNMVENMKNWSKTKGKNSSSMSRKLQSNLHMNKYKEMAHQKKNVIKKADLAEFEKKQKKFFSVTTGFKGYKNKDDLPQCKNIVKIMYRNKSSQPTSIESDVKKLRVHEALHKYGKYINHLPPSSDDDFIEEQKATNIRLSMTLRKPTEDTPFRSTSLTSLVGFTAKKKSFSSLLRDNSATNYNETTEDDIIRIKNTLSGRMVPTQKSTIYKALSTFTPQQIKTQRGMYSSGKDLLSNPFFPKFATKKKKKKGK